MVRSPGGVAHIADWPPLSAVSCPNQMQNDGEDELKKFLALLAVVSLICTVMALPASAQTVGAEPDD